MTKPYLKLSKTSSVLEKLRLDLIRGYFPPGEKLQMEQLKERYGVGYSPLREALSRLIPNGLVQSEELCGFYVPPLSLEELYDIYNVRIQIETLALELSIQYGDTRWESDVISCWHRYAKHLDPEAINTLETAEWDELQKEFCVTLIKACQSPCLLKIHSILYDQTARYRYLCMNHHHNDKKLLRGIRQEMESLVSAVLSRDSEKAIQISQAGWKTSVTIMADILRNKKNEPVSL